MLSLPTRLNHLRAWRRHGNITWLRKTLQREFGLEVWIQAAILFPSAFVSVRRKIRGVDVINVRFLNRWLARTRGNSAVARAIWPKMESVKRVLKP